MFWAASNMIEIMSLNRIFEHAAVRLLTDKAVLFRAGDLTSNMYFVEAGEVDLIRRTTEGNELIFQRARANDILAEASVYSGAYHCDAVAAVQSRLRVVARNTFVERLRACPKLSEAWSAHLANNIQNVRAITAIRAIRRLDDRLDAWLDQGNSLPEAGRWQEVAAEIGVSREALYRELAKRRRNGLNTTADRR